MVKHSMACFQESGYVKQKPLNSAKRDRMYRDIFQHVRYLIIDEVSMIGNTNINQLQSRLNQLYGKSKSDDFFGGINVIFVGDLFQIPPIKQYRVFDPKGLATLGINLWKDLVTFSELTICVRSKDDRQFTELCHRVRTGDHIASDTALLKTRVLPHMPPIESMLDCMVIFTTNTMCGEHNDRCIQHLRNTVPVETVIAHDCFSNEAFNDPTNPEKKNIKTYISDDVNKTAGLPTKLPLGVGARVMIRTNIDVQDKLVNGVCGTVKHIQLKPNAKPPTPDEKNPLQMTRNVKDISCVFIKFDNKKVGKSGMHKCSDKCAKNCILDGTVPICPVEKSYKCKKLKCSNVYLKRFQLPLVLCWAATAHKCQGLTLTIAYIDMSGPYWRAGMAYTAISRLTSLAGLFFVNFDPKAIKTDSVIIAEYNRLRALPKFTFEEPVVAATATPSKKPPTIDRILVPSQSPVLSPLYKKFKPYSSPIVTCSKRPPSDSPLAKVPSKSTKPYASPVQVMPQSPNVLNVDEDSCIGRAYVVDFFNSIESRTIASLLHSLNVTVATSISNTQYGTSCGYIAARVIAKLMNAGHNWFAMPVDDCCYSATSRHDAMDMCALGNVNLGKPGTRPVFLTETECLRLIAFYSQLFYDNAQIDHSQLHQANVEAPQSKTSFRAKLNRLYEKYVVDRIPIPPTFFIVNTDDGDGVHWYTVVLEFRDITGTAQEQ